MAEIRNTVLFRLRNSFKIFVSIIMFDGLSDSSITSENNFHQTSPLNTPNFQRKKSEPLDFVVTLRRRVNLSARCNSMTIPYICGMCTQRVNGKLSSDQDQWRSKFIFETCLTIHSKIYELDPRCTCLVFYSAKARNTFTLIICSQTIRYFCPPQFGALYWRI